LNQKVTYARFCVDKLSVALAPSCVVLFLFSHLFFSPSVASCLSTQITKKAFCE